MELARDRVARMVRDNANMLATNSFGIKAVHPIWANPDTRYAKVCIVNMLGLANAGERFRVGIIR